MAAVSLRCPNLASRLENPIICSCLAYSTCCNHSILSSCRRPKHSPSLARLHGEDKTKRFPVLRLRKRTTVAERAVVCCSAESGTSKNHLRLLDNYLERLDSSRIASSIKDSSADWVIRKEEQDLQILYPSQEYNWKKCISSAGEVNAKKEEEKEAGNRPFAGSTANKIRERGASGASQPIDDDEDILDLHLITALASINIGVFLFELASPLNNPELYSLPFLYGAKINDLIQVGEWWRLFTPMFLHSGAFHVALGCWSLLMFGRQVCRGYGRFTFFLIYTVGGAFGNLTSYLHTAEPTVGGTGPVFALIGAWLIYQHQKQEAAAVAEDADGSVFHKAVMTTGVAFMLSHFGPIDDWTHLGATFSGIVFGFFASPLLRADEQQSRRRNDGGLTMIRGLSDPRKSLAVFGIFVIFFFATVLLVQPPLSTDDIVGYIDSASLF